MKLILLSTPEFFIEEDKIINALFNEGLDGFHLRKPDSEPLYSERLLKLLPDEWHNRIITHEHYYLKSEYNLRGIHIRHFDDIPEGYKGAITTSCHDLDTLQRVGPQVDYTFLSPVFDSISYPERKAAYSSDDLYQATRTGVINRKVMAAGGISAATIPLLKDYGFGGVVILGDIWARFNIHTGLDFKEIIDHFRALRKAAG